MEIRHCPLCGAAYLPGEVSFCVKCGQPLQTKTSIIQDIKRIEQEPNPYNALRFTSTVIIGFGWFVIVIGWAAALLLYGGLLQFLQGFVAVKSGPLFDVASVIFMLMIWSWVTIVGLFVIASGQVFMALLDLRNDMRATMRMIRRFGLAMLDNEKPEP